MNTPHTPQSQPDADILTPSEHAAEERRTPPAPSGPTEESLASQFVAAELGQARRALQMTRVIGLLLVLLVGGELVYITTRFDQSLRPQAAAEIAEGMIVTQVQDKGPEIASQLKAKIPEFLAQTPDYILAQLPVYRQTLEDRVEAQLSQYCQQTSTQLGQHLDGYLEAHKDQIQGMLQAGNEPASVAELGGSLKQELLSYVEEKPQTGESLMEQIQTSLGALEEIEKKTQRLATAKDLTLQEQKTRRAIGILAHSIDTHGQKLHEQVQQIRQSL